MPRGGRLDDQLAARAPEDQRAGQSVLSVDVREGVAGPVVTVSGELDLAGAGLVTAMLDHVRRRLQRPAGGVGRHEQVDVDLARVTFVDSHGLTAVADGRTRIVATSDPVRRLQRLLDDLVRKHPGRMLGGDRTSA